MNELFDEIADAQRSLGISDPLFRGHSSIDYKLLPTLHRTGKLDYERALFYNYKASSTPLNGLTKSNWDIILDMQHYGLPTRLLDWTSSFGTALYFALQGNPESPCIWVLNPYKLNEVSTGNGILYDVSSMPDMGGKAEYSIGNIMAGAGSFDIPYAIRPPHGNSRISAQRGLFTVHMNSTAPLEEQCPDAVKKIILDPDKIEYFKRCLKNLGIDEFSMFPDQEGLAKYLKNMYML